MPARLKWYLPAIQMSLAVLLGHLGSIQFAKRANGRILLDYVAPAEYLLHIVNMPAALVVSAVARNGTFQIGPEHSRWVFSVYVLLIGLLWYLVGRSLSQTRGSEGGGFASIFWDLLFLLYCLASIVISVTPLFIPVSLLFGVAAFVWDATLFALAGRRWFQRYFGRRTKDRLTYLYIHTRKISHRS